MLFVFSPANSFAQSSDIQAEIDAKAKAKADLDAEVKAYQAKLDEVSNQKNTLDRAVKELDLTGKKLTTEVKLTESKIGVVEDSIENLDQDITVRQKTIVDLKRAIGQNIKDLDEADNRSLVMLMLAKGSIAEAIKTSEESRTLNKKMGESIANLMTETEKLGNDKRLLKSIAQFW